MGQRAESGPRSRLRVALDGPGTRRFSSTLCKWCLLAGLVGPPTQRLHARPSSSLIWSTTLLAVWSFRRLQSMERWQHLAQETGVRRKKPAKPPTTLRGERGRSKEAQQSGVTSAWLPFPRLMMIGRRWWCCFGAEQTTTGTAHPGFGLCQTLRKRHRLLVSLPPWLLHLSPAARA